MVPGPSSKVIKLTLDIDVGDTAIDALQKKVLKLYSEMEHLLDVQKKLAASGSTSKLETVKARSASLFSITSELSAQVEDMMKARATWQENASGKPTEANVQKLNDLVKSIRARFNKIKMWDELLNTNLRAIQNGIPEWEQWNKDWELSQTLQSERGNIIDAEAEQMIQEALSGPSKKPRTVTRRKNQDAAKLRKSVAENPAIDAALQNKIDEINAMVGSSENPTAKSLIDELNSMWDLSNATQRVRTGRGSTADEDLVRANAPDEFGLKNRKSVAEVQKETVAKIEKAATESKGAFDIVAKDVDAILDMIQKLEEKAKAQDAIIKAQQNEIKKLSAQNKRETVGNKPSTDFDMTGYTEHERDIIGSQQAKVQNIVDAAAAQKQKLTSAQETLDQFNKSIEMIGANYTDANKEALQSVTIQRDAQQKVVEQEEKMLDDLLASVDEEKEILAKRHAQVSKIVRDRQAVVDKEKEEQALRDANIKNVLEGKVPLNAEEEAKKQAEERAKKVVTEAVTTSGVNDAIAAQENGEVERLKEIVRLHSEVNDTIKARGNFAIKIMNSFNVSLDEAIKNFRQIDPNNKDRLLPTPTEEEIEQIKKYVEYEKELNAAARDTVNKFSGNKTETKNGKTKDLGFVPSRPIISDSEVIVADKVAAKIAAVKQIIDETGVSIANAMNQVGDKNKYVDDQVRLWFDVDKQVKEAVKDADKLQKKIENQKPSSVFGNNFSAAFAGFEMRFTGQQMQMMSKQILLPMQNYAQYAGRSSAISAEWLDTQQQLTESVAMMGQSLNEAALPAFKAIAKIVGEIADFLEKNPAIASTAVTVAAGTYIVGSIANAIGAMLTTYSALQYAAPVAKGLLGKLAAVSATVPGASYGIAAQIATNGAVTATSSGATAATAAAAASAMKPMISSIVAAAVPVLIAAGVVSAAVSAWNLIKQADPNNERNTENSPKQLWALLQGATVFAMSGGNKQLAKSVVYASGVQQNLVDTAPGAKKPNDAAVNEYIAYMKSIKEADKQYAKDKLQLVKDLNDAVAVIEKKYADKIADINQKEDKIKRDADDDAIDAEKSRKDDLAAFQLSEKRAYEDYYRSRMEQTRDYNIDVQRAEEDHQQKMREMQEDHNDKIRDLLDERDAFGIIKETQAYEKERSRTEKDYIKDVGRKDEDFGIKLADQEYQFNIERQRAAEDFKLKLKDEDDRKAVEKERKLRDLEDERAEALKEHDEDMKQLRKENDEKRIQLDAQHTEEMNRLRSDFTDRIRDLDAALLGEQTLRNGYYQAMNTDLQKWLSDQQGIFTSTLPGYPAHKASGGYMPNGIYRTGEQGDEFALTTSSVHIAERIVGSKLTQENIMQAMMAGGRRGNMTVYQNFKFSGDMSAEMRKWYRNEARDAAFEGLNEIL